MTLTHVAAVACAAAVVCAQAYLVGGHRTGVPDVTSAETLEHAVGGPVALTQTFTVGRSGLNAVALTMRQARPDSGGAVVVELAEVRGADVSVPSFRIVRPMRDVATGRATWWRFAPLADSDGRRYQIRVSVPNVPLERGVLVRATRDERHRDGILRVGDRDAWGDAVFAADATSATLLQRLQRERAGGSWWTAVRICSVILLSGAAAYAVVVRCLTVRVRPAVTPSPAGLQGAMTLLLLAGVGLAGASRVWRPASGGREAGAIQLLDDFPDAVKRTSMSHLQDAFRDESVAVGERWRCLLALPSSRVTFHRAVAPGARLRLSYGLRPDTWTGPGDGAAFRVGIGHREQYREVVSEWLNPSAVPADRALRHFELDLSPYAGDAIDIVLNTGPGPSGNGVGDAALWCAPRIVTGER